MLARTAVLLLGAWTGAQLLVSTVVMPIFKGLPPVELRARIRAIGPRMAALMTSLGAAAVGTLIAASLAGAPPSAEGWVKAALCEMGAVVLITLLVHAPINLKFSRLDALSDDQMAALLKRWSSWDWARVVLIAGSFYAATRVLG